MITIKRLVPHLLAAKKTNSSHKRKPQAKRKQAKRQPASTWILLGALGGVLITSSLFIKLTTDSQTTSEPQQVAKNSTQDQQVIAKPLPEKPKTRFDFYTMLPKQSNTKAESSNHSLPKPPPSYKTARTLDLKNQNSPINQYHIQVGSFRDVNDANKLKAKLILTGYDVNVDSVKVNQQKWFRVNIGPFATEQTALKQQKVLEQQKFRGTLILKRDVG